MTRSETHKPSDLRLIEQIVEDMDERALGHVCGLIGMTPDAPKTAIAHSLYVRKLAMSSQIVTHKDLTDRHVGVCG